VRSDSIYVAGYGSWLPPAMSSGDAAACGLVEPGYADMQKMAAVTVAEETAGPEMAAAAGRLALRRAEPYLEGVDLLLHSALYYQGHDMWAPASYVQRRTVGDQCPAIDVRQTSNGGMASLELASAYLRGRSPGRAALLTCGDSFSMPGIDRWRSDPGTVFADGGAALVVAADRGFARLRSLAVISDCELEGMHRGDDPWSPAPRAVRETIDVKKTTRAFLRNAGRSFVTDRMAAGQATAVKAALAEADTSVAEIHKFVLPNFGRRRMDGAFFRPLHIDPARSTWPWGRSVGHLGAGDQFAGLTYLLETGQLEPGQLVAMLGVGGGFSWSCAVLEMVTVPEAAPAVAA
jgi:3-oxoacyl-[acyl-carrier-protein] synthase-3